MQGVDRMCGGQVGFVKLLAFSARKLMPLSHFPFQQYGQCCGVQAGWEEMWSVFIESSEELLEVAHRASFLSGCSFSNLAADWKISLDLVLI